MSNTHQPPRLGDQAQDLVEDGLFAVPFAPGIEKGVVGQEADFPAGTQRRGDTHTLGQGLEAVVEARGQVDQQQDGEQEVPTVSGACHVRQYSQARVPVIHGLGGRLSIRIARRSWRTVLRDRL